MIGTANFEFIYLNDQIARVRGNGGNQLPKSINGKLLLLKQIYGDMMEPIQK